MEVASVLKVARTEERGTKLSFCKCPLGDRLSDGALSCPCESIQPVDWGFVKVARPEFNFVQNGPSGFLETTVTVTVSKLSALCIAKIVESTRFACWGVAFISKILS